MGYHFTMEKKTVAIITTGFVLVGFLLFSAGILMGVHFGVVSATVTVNTPEPATPAEVSQPGPTVDRTANAALSRAETRTQDEFRYRPQPAEEPSKTVTDNTTARNDSRDEDVPDQEHVRERDPLFWVQVGVFRSELEAEKLIYDLEARGYEPAIYEGVDNDERIYFAVRIGSFNDRQEATQIASAFERKEKKRAIVRAVNSL